MSKSSVKHHYFSHQDSISASSKNQLIFALSVLQLWFNLKNGMKVGMNIHNIPQYVAQILHCCSSGRGQQLQLQLDPNPGNLHMPMCKALKRQKKKTHYVFMDNS
uniref:Uncharacterized protein n=1 Tax=Sus scrofa TaxID=9823 RepID=A0A8D1GTP8_PIG